MWVRTSLCQHAHFSISTSERQPSQRQSQPSPFAIAISRPAQSQTRGTSPGSVRTSHLNASPSALSQRRPQRGVRHYPDQSQCQPSPYPSWLTATPALLASTPVQARLVRTSRYVLSCVSTPSHLNIHPSRNLFQLSLSPSRDPSHHCHPSVQRQLSQRQSQY